MTTYRQELKLRVLQENQGGLQVLGARKETLQKENRKGKKIEEGDRYWLERKD